MRRILLFIIIVLTTGSVFAQKSVTKFLGIPVDGSKAAMKQKLVSKGFVYDKREDCLKGEFNGARVKIAILTNNNKVWRIAIIDDFVSNSKEIKQRFNKLCAQFLYNGKYEPLNGENYFIEDDDQIGVVRPLLPPFPNYSYYQHKDKYEAAYYQHDKNSNINDENRIVWFMIEQYNFEYKILMFYDNEYNRSHGEDL